MTNSLFNFVENIPSMNLVFFLFFFPGNKKPKDCHGTDEKVKVLCSLLGFISDVVGHSILSLALFPMLFGLCVC